MPAALSDDGRGPLGRVPPATLKTSCMAAGLRFGNPLARGKENGAAAAVDTAVEARTNLEKCILSLERCLNGEVVESW